MGYTNDPKQKLEYLRSDINSIREMLGAYDESDAATKQHFRHAILQIAEEIAEIFDDSSNCIFQIEMNYRSRHRPKNENKIDQYFDIGSFFSEYKIQNSNKDRYSRKKAIFETAKFYKVSERKVETALVIYNAIAVEMIHLESGTISPSQKRHIENENLITQALDELDQHQETEKR